MSVPSVPVSTGLDPQTQEDEYVHTVYNEIAAHFSQTRYKPWPIVERFLKEQTPYSSGIDVGCGNGKYLSVNPDLFIIGTDYSTGLIECGHMLNSNYNVGVADGLHLPHPRDRFDFALSIAVIHHFATEERRVEAIAHILSRLKVGGRFLVYCWALEQENSRRGYKEGDEQDILIPWVLKKNQPKKKKTKGTSKNKKGREQQVDEQVEAEVKEVSTEAPIENETTAEAEPVADETKYRYYHLYKKGELAANCVAAGGKIIEEGYEKDNWWCIAERVQ